MALRRLLSLRQVGWKREAPRPRRSTFGRLAMPIDDDADAPASSDDVASDAAALDGAEPAGPAPEGDSLPADETPAAASSAVADEQVQTAMSEQTTRPLPAVTRPRPGRSTRRTTGRPVRTTRPTWKDALWAQAGAAGVLQPEPETKQTGTAPAADTPTSASATASPAIAMPIARLRSAGRWLVSVPSRLRHDPRFPPLPGQRKRLWFRLANTALLVVVLLLSAAGFLSANARIAALHAEAVDGFTHLQRLHTLAPSTDALLNALSSGDGSLADIQRELAAAEHDFAALRHDLDAPAGPLFLATRVPGSDATLTAARTLSTAADESCLAGLALASAAPIVTNALTGGLFETGAQGATTPALTTETLKTLEQDVDSALAHLQAATLASDHSDLRALSGVLRPAELAQARALIATWPAQTRRLERLRAWLSVLPQVLGIGSPSTYLLEVLDRAELRPTGGYIDNYALLTVANGRIQPFTLSDPYLLDAPFVAQHGGYVPAAPAYSWWPWAYQFTLRDSNLSPDFPTAAQVGMKQLQAEGGPGAQGVIAVTAPFVQHLLQITGPIQVPDYNETITADTVEQSVHLHEAQLTSTVASSVPHADQISTVRKRFTALLGRALVAKLRTLSASQVLALAHVAVADLGTKDLQVYFGDQHAEALLSASGLDGALPHGLGDAVTIVDANTGSNKANPFVTVAYNDAVSLDQVTGATHALSITYRFHASDLAALYGPDVYVTYVRVYVPAGAQLTHVEGLSDIYRADQLSGRSDEPDRQMWGGYVVVRDSQPTTLRLSWVVPHVVGADPSAPLYRLDFQHQEGSMQTLRLSLRRPGANSFDATYTGALDRDLVFTVN
jgi:hypothetical protein